MSEIVTGPKGTARWHRIPWLVPKRFASWVPLPATIISRFHAGEVGSLHFYHELAHVWQIDRDGYFRTVWNRWKWRNYDSKDNPGEVEARQLAEEWSQ